MKWIKIADYFTEFPETKEETVDVVFGGSLMVKIEKGGNKWKVINAVNGWGNNCFSDFIQEDVVILIPEILSSGETTGENEAERILCAAIHYDDGLTYNHQPVNIETGLVLCGRRHHNIMYNWNQLSGGKTKRTDTQGFITSLDRFIDRKEAMELAKKTGQVTSQQSFEELFSEDLY